jgi:hypothetical protein
MTNSNVLPQPKPWRVALGFLVAPLVPAALWLLPGLLYGATAASYGSFVILIAVYAAYPPTLLLGLPTYFVLRRWIRPRFMTILLVAGLIAAVPWSALLLMLPNPQDAWTGACHTVVDGRTTWCGYLEGMKFIGLVFGLGAIAGAVFWTCVVWRDARLGSNGTER